MFTGPHITPRDCFLELIPAARTGAEVASTNNKLDTYFLNNKYGK